MPLVYRRNMQKVTTINLHFGWRVIDFQIEMHFQEDEEEDRCWFDAEMLNKFQKTDKMLDYQNMTKDWLLFCTQCWFFLCVSLVIFMTNWSSSSFTIERTYEWMPDPFNGLCLCVCHCHWSTLNSFITMDMS